MLIPESQWLHVARFPFLLSIVPMSLEDRVGSASCTCWESGWCKFCHLQLHKGDLWPPGSGVPVPPPKWDWESEVLSARGVTVVGPLPSHTMARISLRALPDAEEIQRIRWDFSLQIQSVLFLKLESKHSQSTLRWWEKLSSPSLFRLWDLKASREDSDSMGSSKNWSEFIVFGFRNQELGEQWYLCLVKLDFSTTVVYKKK